MKKITALFSILIIGYVLPLAGNIKLLFHPFIILSILACCVIIISQPSIGVKEAKAASPMDKNSFSVIYLFAMVGLIVPILEWAYFKPLHSSLNWISLFGIGLLFCGLFIRVWAIRILGKFFTATVQIQKSHELINSGPYRLVRHPSYLGAYLTYIASGLILNAYIGTVVAALAMFLAYYYRISAEENALLGNFGERYVKYQKETNRMIPWLW